MDVGEFLSKFQKKGDLELDQIVHLWSTMFRAVNTCHEVGVVHFDLKPGNFLSCNAKLKLADFGIAAAMDGETHISRHGIGGTPRYLAPETLRQGGKYGYDMILFSILQLKSKF